MIVIIVRSVVDTEVENHIVNQEYIMNLFHAAIDPRKIVLMGTGTL